jgi:hypothetical protein
MYKDEQLCCLSFQNKNSRKPHLNKCYLRNITLYVPHLINTNTEGYMAVVTMSVQEEVK